MSGSGWKVGLDFVLIFILIFNVVSQKVIFFLQDTQLKMLYDTRFQKRVLIIVHCFQMRFNEFNCLFMYMYKKCPRLISNGKFTISNPLSSSQPLEAHS